MVPTDSQVLLYESSKDITYRQLQPIEKAYECDATVFQRLQEICLGTCGWRRYNPFYGIVDVKEIKVSVFRFYLSGRFLGRKH